MGEGAKEGWGRERRRGEGEVAKEGWGERVKEHYITNRINSLFFPLSSLPTPHLSSLGNLHISAGSQCTPGAMRRSFKEICG